MSGLLQIPEHPGQMNVKRNFTLKPSLKKQKLAIHQKFVLAGCIWEIVDLRQSGCLLTAKLRGPIGDVQKKKPKLIWSS